MGRRRIRQNRQSILAKCESMPENFVTFDCEEIEFSRPVDSETDVFIGTYVNAIRWVCSFLASVFRPPLARVSVVSRVAFAKSSVPGLSNVLYFCLDRPSKESIAVTLSCKPPSLGLLELYKKEKKKQFKNPDINWKLAMNSILRSLKEDLPQMSLSHNY